MHSASLGYASLRYPLHSNPHIFFCFRCISLSRLFVFREHASADNQINVTIDQAKTSAMACSDQSVPPVRRCTKTEFRAWLGRAKPGQPMEYHRGLLTWDRSPASGLTNHERRMLARVADAALEAAEGGLVHLAQRRHGPLDFSYLAIRAADTGRPSSARAVPVRRIIPLAFLAEAA